MNERGLVKVESALKRVRALLSGQFVMDTTSALLVWEVPYYPSYYIPAAGVRHELHPTGDRRHSPILGDAKYSMCASAT